MMMMKDKTVPKFDRQCVDRIIEIIIKEWCDEFPYGETCKHCTSEPLCEAIDEAIEPELYNRTTPLILEEFDDIQ
jgi:hypothetical protein